MKKIQHMLPCGRVMIYRQHDVDDLLRHLGPTYLKNYSGLQPFVPVSRAGGAKKRWSKMVNSKFATLVLRKLMDHLMKGDRLETRKGRFWMIAGASDPTKRWLNWHTEGKVYGVVISDLDKKTYGFTLRRSRRRELRKRILGGQNFHQI